MLQTIQVVNTASNTVAANDIVPLGSTVHSAGTKCSLKSNGVMCKGKGMFRFDVSVVATGTGLSFQLYANGVPMTGALATSTGDTGTAFNLSFPALYYNERCCDRTLVTLVNTGTATVVTNVDMVVTKLCE